MSARRCGCAKFCGDDGDIDGQGVCKGLPVKREPLVEIVLVPKYPANVRRSLPDFANKNEGSRG